jgi:putative DNA methylase
VGKKLIEVAPFLPLDAISVASKADKDKKTGTIKNVHKWFAPMPTPALRALIFAASVDAPEDAAERERLFDLVKRLVPSDGNPPDEATLKEAQEAILAGAGSPLPVVFDPFCGGGSTLIEAQRLGLPAMGSDLNPVPALITRTLTELIPKVAGRRPVAANTGQFGQFGPHGLDGFLADLQHYAEMIRERVWRGLSDLYPSGPRGETILAWLWARTVQCTNPACGVRTPLISSTWLSKRKGMVYWTEPRVVGGQVSFAVVKGPGSPSTKGTVTRSGGAVCVVCRTQIPFSDIRDAGAARKMGLQLMAAAATSSAGRIFLSPEDVPNVSVPEPPDPPDLALEGKATVNLGLYGFEVQSDLYTDRQLLMLEAFASEIAAIGGQIAKDGGDSVYATTMVSVLALALGKLAQSNSTQTRWYIDARNGSSQTLPAFGRHALPMVWDFSEVNPFAGSVGDWMGQISSISRGLEKLPLGATPAIVRRADARSAANDLGQSALIVTDPPYFDQISYADLSDYFYVWHRKALRSVHPDFYGTMATPKTEELIATPHRHGGDKEASARYFVEGFTETFRSVKQAAKPDCPVLIVYAHRQEEKSSLGSASTGWDAMLEAVLAAGLTIEGTLPIRGTHSSRQIGLGANAVASYVVMVCRPRQARSAPGSIADFRSQLRSRLPAAADALLASGESMVDVRQAAIGPGMEVFSQFSEVFDGTDPIPVRRALSIINEELGRILDEHLGEVDDETRWACQWYADHGYEQGDYDEGRKLAQAYGLGVDGLAAAGIVEQGRGRIRLLQRADLPANWMGDARVPAWEACQHLVKRLTEGSSAGESAAAELLAALGARANGVRELCQFLTNLAIEKGWSEDAIAYDSLVKSWPRIEQLSAGRDTASSKTDARLFETEG